MAMAADGRLLASAVGDCQLKLWDVAAQLAPRPFAGVEAKVRSLVCSAESKVLASATSDGVVQLWDLNRGRERCDPIKFETQDIQLALSPDGKILAIPPVGTRPGKPKLWDTATGRELDFPAVEPVDARFLAFMPDGKTLATIGGPLTLLPLDGKRPTRTFEESEGLARSIAVSPDGSRIATAVGIGNVTIWDIADGVSCATLKGHGGAVLSVAFSPDGKTLASSAGDRTVRLWDVSAWTERATLRGPVVPVRSLAFGPTARRLRRRRTATPPSRSGMWPAVDLPRHSPCPTCYPATASLAWRSPPTAPGSTREANGASRSGT